MIDPHIAHLVAVHGASGAKLAQVLYAELAGFDPDVHAQAFAEALDAAMRGMLDVVDGILDAHEIEDPDAREAVADAALKGFSARWRALTGRSTGGSHEGRPN